MNEFAMPIELMKFVNNNMPVLGFPFSKSLLFAPVWVFSKQPQSSKIITVPSCK